MNSNKVRAAAALLMGLLLMFAAGCASLTEKDSSGMTRGETMGLPFEEQYALAGERYVELNERFVELQREIFADEWQGVTSTDLIPRQGFTHGSALRGDGRRDSYYFSVWRAHPADGSTRMLFAAVERSWAERGWEVGEQVSEITGELRITADTPDGYWFAASEEGNELHLSGSSPVYWGERRPLSRAINARKNAVLKETDPWFEQPDGRKPALPGVYAPFPAWDTITDADSDRADDE